MFGTTTRAISRRVNSSSCVQPLSALLAADRYCPLREVDLNVVLYCSIVVLKKTLGRPKSVPVIPSTHIAQTRTDVPMLTNSDQYYV